MIPKILYHYTTIETLALILKGKKIRFNSIGLVDDLTESVCKDYGNIGHLVLISCWTNKSEENIALWNIYSKNGKGCRIELPSNLFTKDIEIKSDKYVVNHEFNLLYPKNNLFEMKYRASIDLKPIFDREIFDFSNIGKTKELHWIFQSEWRFILYQLSKELFDNIKQSKIENLKDYPFKLSHYDLSIREEAFQKMKILLGPHTTSSEEIIVNALASKYNPTSSVDISKLRGKIKLKTG